MDTLFDEIADIAEHFIVNSYDWEAEQEFFVVFNGCYGESLL